MNYLKINNREPVEYLGGKGLLKVSAPCKYIFLFLAYIYRHSLIGFFACLWLRFFCFVFLCVWLCLRYSLFWKINKHESCHTVNHRVQPYPLHSDLRRAFWFDVCAFFLPYLRLIALRVPSGAFRILTLWPHSPLSSYPFSSSCTNVSFSLRSSARTSDANVTTFPEASIHGWLSLLFWWFAAVFPLLPADRILRVPPRPKLKDEKRKPMKSNHNLQYHSTVLHVNSWKAGNGSSEVCSSFVWISASSFRNDLAVVLGTVQNN